MAYHLCTLYLGIVGICCFGFGNTSIIGERTNEPEIPKYQLGQGTCEWERPPQNGHSLHSCSEGLGQESTGLHMMICNSRSTHCNPHYVLVGGADEDTCVNGQWSSSGHKCISCGRSQVTLNPFDNPVQVTALIQHGNVSSLGYFPWMVALYTLQYGRWEHICGGTLISPRIVLTAAHCLGVVGQQLKPEDLRVKLGKLFRSFDQPENSSVTSFVKEIIVPERYKGAINMFEMDIALLALQQSVDPGTNIMPACVDWGHTLEPKPDGIGYLAGWGDTELGRPSDVLRWTSQKYIQYEQCQNLIHPTKKKFLTQDKICIAEVNGGRADHGDSGGGLTFLHEGVHYVYGVVSVKIDEYNVTDDKNMRMFTNVMNDGHLYWLRKHWRRLNLEHPEIKKKEKAFTVFSSEEKSWSDALADCRSRNMTLASTENVEEYRKLVRQLDSEEEQDIWNTFWLSGRYHYGEGKWVWESSGRNVTSAKLSRDYCDDVAGTNNECMGLSHFRVSKLTCWNCFMLSGYICEYWK